MWKDRIRPGNPEKLGVTRAGRELNFAVAVQDGKDCSLLLYRKGMDEPELELGFTDDMRFGEICAMGLEDRQKSRTGSLCGIHKGKRDLGKSGGRRKASLSDPV